MHALLLALALSAAPAAAQTRQVLYKSVYDAVRAAIVQTPAELKSPDIVLALHGSTQITSPDPAAEAPAAAMEQLGLFGAASTDGFVVVYVAARISNGWACWENGNDTGGDGGYPDGTADLCALADTGGDAAWFESVVTSVRALVPFTQEGKVLVFGASGGGSMAWRLACTAAGFSVDGAAAFSGVLAPALAALDSTSCAGVPVVAFHGDEDTIVPLAVAEAGAAWYAARHGTGAPAESDVVNAGSATKPPLSALRRTYEAAAETWLSYWVVENLGHKVPRLMRNGICGVSTAWAELHALDDDGAAEDEDEDDGAARLPALAAVVVAVAAALLA